MNIIELIFYCMGGLILILIALVIFLIIRYNKYKNSDKIIIIDKTNRWSIIERNFKNTDIIPISKKTYINVKEAAILSHKGKALLIFSDNNPIPLKLSYSSPEWLSSETLMETINNELIKLMVQLEDKVKDMFLILGAIGGLIAGIASIIILLRAYGAI